MPFKLNKLINKSINKQNLAPTAAGFQNVNVMKALTSRKCAVRNFLLRNVFTSLFTQVIIVFSI